MEIHIKLQMMDVVRPTAARRNKERERKKKERTLTALTGRLLCWTARSEPLLRAQPGRERVLSSLREPSPVDQETSKTAALMTKGIEKLH